MVLQAMTAFFYFLDPATAGSRHSIFPHSRSLVSEALTENPFTGRMGVHFHVTDTRFLPGYDIKMRLVVFEADRRKYPYYL